MATKPLDALKKVPGVATVDAASIDSWLKSQTGLSALLFAGVTKGRPEGHDVAVALREMIKLYPDSLTLGVVASTEAENAIKARFRVVVMPSLVVFNRGEQLEVMPRVRDWAEYADLFARYLGRPRTAA